MANAKNTPETTPAASKNTLVPDKAVFKFGAVFVVALVLFLALKFLTRNADGVKNIFASERLSTSSNSVPQSTCFGGSFQVNAGDTVRTVPTVDLSSGLGCYYAILSNNPFLAYSRYANSLNHRWITIPRDGSDWCGIGPQGLIWIRGLKDSTEITFRFVGLARDQNGCR